MPSWTGELFILVCVVGWAFIVSKHSCIANCISTGTSVARGCKPKPREYTKSNPSVTEFIAR